MFDIFTKFSEYSLTVRLIVVGWIVYSALLGIIVIFSKPASKDDSASSPPVNTSHFSSTIPTPTKLQKPQSIGIRITNVKDSKFENVKSSGSDVNIDIRDSQNITFDKLESTKHSDNSSKE